jgi:hypothetical protein
MPYTEAALQEAILAVGNGMPKAKAAHRFGIPRSTLHDRLSGGSSQKQRDTDQQLLSEEQERLLAQWATVQHGLRCPPSHRTLRMVASKILENGGRPPTLGKHWITKFLRRHPELKTLQGKPIGNDRIQGVQPDNIKALFATLNGPFIRGIRPQHRYNFDETGLMEGFGFNGKVVGAAKRPNGKKNRVAFVKSSQSRTWVTIIEAIDAEGNYIPPVVIFKGESVQAQWFPSKFTQFRN